jgi:hypothetical protein
VRKQENASAHGYRKKDPKIMGDRTEFRLIPAKMVKNSDSKLVKSSPSYKEDHEESTESAGYVEKV